MQTINFLTSHFLPENTACTNRVVSYVSELEKEYKINIICLTEKGVAPQDKVVKYSDNSTIYYHYQEDFDGKNFFKRAFYELKYINRLITTARMLQSDLTIATSPYMFMIPLVAFRINGDKVIDIRDMVWEYLGENSFLQRFIKISLKKTMSVAMKRYKSIVVTNDYEYKLVSEEYLLNNISIIPNGISQERYIQLSKINNKENNRFTVTYVGNLGLAQNIMLLLHAAKDLPDIYFVIIGSGIELEKLKSYVKINKLNNVHFTGKLEWKELESYYQETSVLYAQLNKEFTSAMPSKLYEYATVALPIIYGGVGQATKFVEKLDNAIVVEPNNKSELLLAINSFRKQSVGISKRNRELIFKNFLREGLVNKYIDHIVSRTKSQKKSMANV